MRINRRGGVLAAVAVCVLASSANVGHAQDVPYDPAVDVQLFEYAIGPKSFLTVSDAEIQHKESFNVDFLVTFLTDPFTIYNTDAEGSDLGTTRTEVVQSMLAGEVSGAYGLLPKLQVGVSLQMIFSMSGQGLDPATAMPPAGDGLQISGLGDLRLEGKYRLYEQGAIKLAGMGGLTLPTSFGAGGNEFLGDDLPSLRGKVAAQWTDRGGKMVAGANLGVLFRKPRTIYSSEVGQQLTYGAGGAFHVNDRVSAIAEIFGRGGLTSLDLSQSPLEAGAGVRVQATQSISVLAGGGAGLVAGIGSPGLRAFVSVGWAPDFRDSDNDGIRNDKDRCPLEPEDFDGFQDGDGCPDPDNDGDRRLDAEDKCPNEPEDIDGFEDDDGCPDPDNDGDGIPDGEDRCPNDAEDGKEPNPKDGCPLTAIDSDDDGVKDAFDHCPMDPEDRDGFEDWDGCPDPDNDQDGVLDEVDQCPLCIGTGTEDGCPVLGSGVDPRIARIDGDKLQLGAPVTFGRRESLSEPGGKLIDAAAAVMKAAPEVTQWAVVVAVKKTGSERAGQAKADKRAQAIKDRLVGAGVDEGTFSVLAAVSTDDQISIVARERQEIEASGEFVCPAHLLVTPREAPATPTPVDTGAGATPAEGGSAAAADPTTVPDSFGLLTGAVEIEFKAGTTTLIKGSEILDELAELLEQSSFVVVEIGAHTDSKPGEKKARELTEKQAAVLVQYLTDKGVDPSQVKGVGYGMDEPRAPNKTSRGRGENRRVELKYSVK
ncbi:MAG TPA: OmpA family protein [Kofleriaceae bacterium]|nr:OmpA family protein [Kofleriaceae bacterium]